MPYTLILSQSSRAMVIVNQPVLSQEFDILLQRKGEGEEGEKWHLHGFNAGTTRRIKKTVSYLTC